MGLAAQGQEVVTRRSPVSRLVIEPALAGEGLVGADHDRLRMVHGQRPRLPLRQMAGERRTVAIAKALLGSVLVIGGRYRGERHPGPARRSRRALLWEARMIMLMQ